MIRFLLALGCVLVLLTGPTLAQDKPPAKPGAAPGAVIALEKGGEIRDGESAVAWFYRLLRNALADHWRKRAADRRAIERRARETKETADAPDPALEGAVCKCVNGLVPLLKPDFAVLIGKVDLGGEEVASAGRDLGLSAGNARVRLHRARAALRKELARACGTCADHGCMDCSCGGKGA